MLWHHNARVNSHHAKMKANAEPHLLSSLVWIDQYNEYNLITSFMEFMLKEVSKPLQSFHHPKALGCEWELLEIKLLRTFQFFFILKIFDCTGQSMHAEIHNQKNIWVLVMSSMKLVIPFHWLYWSIHTKDESKRGTAFAFIFGVNWLWRCAVTASFGHPGGLFGYFVGH